MTVGLDTNSWLREQNPRIAAAAGSVRIRIRIPLAERESHQPRGSSAIEQRPVRQRTCGQWSCGPQRSDSPLDDAIRRWRV